MKSDAYIPRGDAQKNLFMLSTKYDYSNTNNLDDVSQLRCYDINLLLTKLRRFGKENRTPSKHIYIFKKKNLGY